MANAENELVQRAENFLSEYMARQLVAQGHQEAVGGIRKTLRAKVAGVTDLGALQTVSFQMFHHVTDFTAKLNAVDGETMGWYFELLSHQSTRKVSPAAALEAAANAVQPLPLEAREVVSEYDDVDGRPVFVARWHHYEHDVLIEGDFIHVLVNGELGRAFAMYRKWHRVNPEFSER